MTRTTLIILGIVLLVGLGFYAYYWNNSTDIPSPTATTTDTGATTTPPAPTTDSKATPPSPKAVTITYGPNGFSPSTITVPVGATVTWVNSGSGRMWIGSNDHPTHTRYDGSSTGEHCTGGAPTSTGVFDQCGAGSTYTFTFTKAGTWEYHNHAQASAHGTVIVE